MMRQLLIKTTTLVAVLVCGWAVLLNPWSTTTSHTATANLQLEAGVRSYCAKSRGLLGHAYFAGREKTCRSARRLLA